MSWAKIRYDILVEKKEWNAPTEEEKQILALQAQVNNIKKNTGGNSKNNRNKNNNKNNNKDGNDTSTRPQWLTQEPGKDKLTKPREWMNKLWYWCGQKTGGKCEKYRQHKPSECEERYYYYYKKRKAENQDAPKNKPEVPKKAPTKKPKVEEKDKKRQFLKVMKSRMTVRKVDS